LGGYRWSLAELARAERELKSGQPAVAGARLERLAAMGLGGGGARDWQGGCQGGPGELDAAVATHAARPPRSARDAHAARRRAHLAWERGQFAVVEEALEPAEFPRTSAAFALRESRLQQLDLFTGRFDDLRRRIQAEWAGAANKAEVLHKHFLVDNARSFPV